LTSIKYNKDGQFRITKLYPFLKFHQEYKCNKFCRWSDTIRPYTETSIIFQLQFRIVKLYPFPKFHQEYKTSKFSRHSGTLRHYTETILNSIPEWN
jgi:hypothetical protein